MGSRVEFYAGIRRDARVLSAASFDDDGVTVGGMRWAGSKAPPGYPGGALVVMVSR